MKPVMCRMSEEQYEVLRALAFERRTSMAELIRQAIEKTYAEDLADVRDMKRELAEHRADPTTSMDYAEYRRERLSGLRSPDAALGQKPLREYTDEEIQRFLAEDKIDEETAQAVRRLLAQGKL